MKVLYSWLQEFVNIDIQASELAEKLTMAGLEVTGIDKVDSDWVLEIEVTSNRPDCLSIVGIARECAMVVNRRFKPPKISYLPKVSAAYIRESDFEIIIEDKDACPRYIGRILLNVKIKTSPNFIKERLEKLGFRSINNVVDITNYVMLELGQPMHAFDYDKIEDKKIIVRFAKEGEKIITIEGQERSLFNEDLVIADIKKPIALAGLIGGKDTEVSQDTVNILLESAYFEPLIVRQSSLKHGIKTESCYRFERGVDFMTVDSASKYAVELIRKYACDEKKVVLIDKSIDLIKKQIPVSKKVFLNFSDIDRTLGIMPSAFWVRKLIHDLGCEIVSVTKEGLKLQAPSYRLDLKESIDYIEEIARFHGYDKIPQSKLPELIIEKDPELKEFGEKDFEDRIRNILVNLGLNETISYALLSEQEIAKFNFKNILSLNNPIAKSYAILRPSILPSLLKTAQYNFNRNIYDLALYELGKIYNFKQEPRERKVLGVLLSGLKYQDYFGHRVSYNFSDLKAILETLFSCLGIKNFKIQEAENIFFKDICSARIKLADKEIAILGEVSQTAKDYYELKPEIYIAQVYLDVIKEKADLEIRYREISQYPFITRDISLLLSKRVPSAKVLELINRRSSLIQGVNLIDIYSGQQVPADMVSLTFRIKFQSYERTLLDSEVDEVMKDLHDVLIKEFACQIRE